MVEMISFQRYLGYDFTDSDKADFDLDVEKSLITHSLVDLNSLKLKITLPNIDDAPDQSLAYGHQKDTIYVAWVNVYGHKPCPPKAVFNYIIDSQRELSL